MGTHTLPTGRHTKVEEYVREDESRPYRKWFDGLSVDVAALVARAKTRMSLGNLGNVKPLQGSVHGYKIDHGAVFRSLPGRRPAKTSG